MNTNVREGKNWFQVDECREGRSQTTQNEYWVLTCQILPNPNATRKNWPTETLSVYFMKKHEWALQALQDIVVACGADKPWNLYGKRFIADVVIKNDFVSLKRPRPYTETEEPEPGTDGEGGINSKSEWPW